MVSVIYLLGVQGGTGYARKISFQGIKFEAVDNPIEIEQFYCPLKQNCKNDVRIID